MFGSLGAPELIIIGLIIVLLFGVGKLSGLGRDLGQSVKEFRKAVKDEEKQAQDNQAQAYAPPPPPTQYVPPAQQYTPPPASPQQQYTPPPSEQTSGETTKGPRVF